MFNIFYPNLYIKNIKSIPYDNLINNNIKTLIFDLDNTIVPNNIKEASLDIIMFFNKLKNKGFKICILSNNNENRVKLFTKNLDILYIADAKKPRSKGILKAIYLLNTKCNNTAIIGDQIFTDILCGNINKIYTILVKPISKNEKFLIKIKRIIEKIIIKSYEKNKTKL